MTQQTQTQDTTANTHALKLRSHRNGTWMLTIAGERRPDQEFFDRWIEACEAGTADVHAEYWENTKAGMDGPEGMNLWSEDLDALVAFARSVAEGLGVDIEVVVEEPKAPPPEIMAELDATAAKLGWTVDQRLQAVLSYVCSTSSGSALVEFLKIRQLQV